jgi:hypothetical protein
MAERDPARQQLAKRRYYEANKDVVKARTRARNKAVQDTVRVWLYEYLKTHPCVDCGETDPIILEFDHIRDKEFSIGDAARKNITLKRVIAEVEKCEVRCANCHRTKTYRAAGRTHRG